MMGFAVARMPCGSCQIVSYPGGKNTIPIFVLTESNGLRAKPLMSAAEEFLLFVRSCPIANDVLASYAI